MTAKCVGCGLSWNISIYQAIPRSGYTCPVCYSRIMAGETIREIKAHPKNHKPKGGRRHGNPER